MVEPAETRAMREAIALAANLDFRPGPNPRVGCVVLGSSGDVVGRGHHRGAGQPHAEVVALHDARGRTQGGTAVVTLEPCAHHGRTPPCTDALIAAGIARVVFASTDPHVAAQGGLSVLTAAGIEVQGGLLADEAELLNREWLFSHRAGRPFVTLKAASSLDGRITAVDGTSRWLSGPQSREDAHAWRGQVDAIVVGTGTVAADDPELTDRRPQADRQPLRVVIGRRQLPSSSRVFNDSAETVVYRHHDVKVVLADLLDRGVHHVLVEGGATMTTAFLQAGCADRLLWYLTPLLLGGGLPVVEDLGIGSLDEAPRWSVESIEQRGDDVRVTYLKDNGNLAPPLHARA